MNWVYIHALAPEDIVTGGRTRTQAGTSRPQYRVEVTLMAGAWSEAHRQEIAALVTAAVIRAEGGHINPLNAARVWVIFHEVPDGQWAASGRLYGLDDVLRYVTGNPTHPIAGQSP
jgi:phenylpyruvate tautomerase PptA (4-oxalocrotonate tautomerase family)